jgi:hypothetical protein
MLELSQRQRIVLVDLIDQRIKAKHIGQWTRENLTELLLSLDVSEDELERLKDKLIKEV